MADAAQPADAERVVPVSKRPRGKALRWPGAQLDKLSAVTPADIERARERWRELVPSKFKTLLDATARRA